VRRFQAADWPGVQAGALSPFVVRRRADRARTIAAADSIGIAGSIRISSRIGAGPPSMIGAGESK